MSNNDPDQYDDDFPGVNFALWGHGSQTAREVTPFVTRWRAAGEDEDKPGFENAVRMIEDQQ